LRDAPMLGLGAAGTATTWTGTSGRDQVVVIRVATAMPGGTRFTREVTVGLRGTAREGEQPWQILA
jgi:hypothetical protein